MITKEAIEAALNAYYGNDVEHGQLAREQMEAAVTAAIAAMPGPAVKVEYASRSTGGFAPAQDLAAENERLRAALEFYADPAIYKPHPHGPAFDRRDLSYHARAALKDRT